MADIGDVAKKALADRTKTYDADGNFLDYKENGIFDRHGRAEKKLDKMAPANKKTINPIENAEATSKRSMTSGIAEEAPFSKLERDLPKGGRGLRVAAEEGLEKEGSGIAGQVAKRGLGKLEKMGMAGLAGGALGLGVNALMEGLDAEEAGSDEERMDEAARGQYMKTEAKLKADKANSLKASTKKRVEALPSVVKETTVYRPQPRSEDEIVRGFHEQLDKNYGPDEAEAVHNAQEEEQEPQSKVKIEGLDNIGKVMRDEMKQGAARSNKKPISKFMKR